MADETIIEVTPADIKAREKMIGKKFEHLTVIKALDEKVIKYNDRQKFRQWVCQCDCGRTRIARDDILRRGMAKTCGDKNCEYKGSRLIDLTGKRFGKLTVIERAADYISPKGKATTQWRCKCDCGNETVARTDLLRHGYTQSCGCINATQGGAWKLPMYQTYSGMMDRCYNQKCESYPHYGARGITVCDEWKNSALAFCEWSFANGYKENSGLSIDRIDVNGNYCPENCRWTDIKTQNNNKTDTHHVTYNGETHTYSEWADILNLGLTRGVIYNRIFNGWDDVAAITTPPGGKKTKRSVG